MEDAPTFTDQQVTELWSTVITDERLTPADVRIYAIICTLAQNHGEIILPGRFVMAQLCRINHETVVECYRHLADTGWVHFQDLTPGKPRTVTVNLPEAVKSYRSRIVKLEESPLPAPAGTLPKSLHELARSIKLLVNGRPQVLPGDNILIELSGNAPAVDIHQALLVLSRYQHKGTPVTRVLSLWKSLFEKGHFIMARIPRQNFSIRSSKDMPESTVQERQAAARELAQGRTVEIGKLLPKLREYLERADALEVRYPHVSLRVGFELILDKEKKTARVDRIQKEDIPDVQKVTP